MRIAWCFLCGLICILGCAKVRVEAPKEPIKVDITMRLDIYQHVQKDIDAIENIVSGPQKQAVPSDKQSMLDCFVSNAYAQDDLSPEVQEAALRRKERRSELAPWLEKGVIGESKAGLLEIRNNQSADASVQQLVASENSDRMAIYYALAQKNGTTAEEIQKMYAERLQKDAPSGTPIEVLNIMTGAYEWKTK